MRQDTLKTLEYEKIRARLSSYTSSQLGKSLVMSLQPSNDFDEVERLLQETAEAVEILKFTAPPMGGIADIRGYLDKAKKNIVLTLPELAAVRNTMYGMRNLKRFFKELEADFPLLKEWAHSLEILGQLERELENTLDEHDNLRDDASVELLRIRRQLRSSQAQIKKTIGSILHSQQYQKFFQENLVTMRGDRYVIPIKQEYRSQFPGIVHDRSSSGATLFIEPLAVVELNNDIKQLTLEEQQEIERILQHLTRLIDRENEVLAANCRILAKLDFTFAKAKLAEDMEAVAPELNTENIIRLEGARHPLLAKEKVVPIDIVLGEGYSMLLVTGPNTGGKTVCMKTLGLLVLLAQSGCFVPAKTGAQLPVFHNVYTDIGDEQSIEQSLSTFSAHMTNIVGILQKVESDDLLLLDELGAGTDPEEGAALAMAILERLLQIKAAVMATTHYSELKTFAYTREGIENACVEFDVETLRPTYRLLLGIPGASNAFAISRRLGLSEAMVLRAKQLIQADHAQFENVINQLEQEKIMYAQRNAELREREIQVSKLEEKVRALRDEVTAKKTQIIRKAKEESASLIRKTRRESEEVIKQLKEQFNDQGIKKRQQAIQQARETMKEASGRVRLKNVNKYDFQDKIDLATLEIGDTVYVVSLDQKGTVAAISGKELVVQLGSMNMTVPAKKCRFVAHHAPVKQQKQAKAGGFVQKTMNVHRDIDIRGLMVDEAVVMLDKFLDDAMIAGLSQVLIIHGKGTGALRKGVHAYLKRHNNVLSYNFADMAEGGTGATLVELK